MSMHNTDKGYKKLTNSWIQSVKVPSFWTQTKSKELYLGINLVESFWQTPCECKNTNIQGFVFLHPQPLPRDIRVQRVLPSNCDGLWNEVVEMRRASDQGGVAKTVDFRETLSSCVRGSVYLSIFFFFFCQITLAWPIIFKW